MDSHIHVVVSRVDYWFPGRAERVVTRLGQIVEEGVPRVKVFIVQYRVLGLGTLARVFRETNRGDRFGTFDMLIVAR